MLRVWHHAGWLLAVVALGCCTDAHSSHFGAVWVLLAISLWAVAKRNRSLEAVAFGGTLISAHALLAHLGIAFSTGAPPESILPWFALASTLVAVWPLARTTSLSRKIFAYFAVTLAVSELCAGIVLLEGAHLPEALAGVVAMGLAAALLIRRALKDDSIGAALLAQAAAIAGLVALHHLGLGAQLGPAETWLFLTSGLVLSELQLSNRAAPQVSIALGIGAIAWPALGALALLGQAPSFIALALMLVAAHFAIRARSTLHRGTAAVASVAAFNAAMFFGFNATGWLGPEYLAIPFGLSLLTLVWVFKGSLEAVTAARLRAVAVAVIYAAASVKPLTFEAPWALWVCVLICVLGVASGIVLRIRSFVFLGTAFMVTSVVANLIRYGIREPRAGAIFLSGLGLLVVAFMVLVTTKRSELLARYKSVQAMLERWD